MPQASIKDVFARRLRSFDRRQLLRPMRSGEIFDLSIRIYRQHARELLPAAFVPILLSTAGILFFQTLAMPLLFLTRQEGLAGQIGEVAFALATGVLVAAPLFVLGLGMANGPAIRVAARAMRGDDVTVHKEIEAGRARAWLIAVTLFKACLQAFWILAAAIVLVSFSAVISAWGLQETPLYLMAAAAGVLGLAVALFSVPYFAHRLSLAPVVAALEGLPAKESLARSRDLLTGTQRHGNGLGTNLVLWLVLVAAFFIITGGVSLVFGVLQVEAFVNGLLWLGWLRAVLAMAVSVAPGLLAIWLLAPLYGIVCTVHYFDRVIRLEAYDIRVLAEDVNIAVQKTSL